ncbi:MAG: trypsin-like peptidase domain-containing protein, partial [Planctomycetota bacterium]
MSPEQPVDTVRARRNLVAFFGVAIPAFFFSAFLATLVLRQAGVSEPALHQNAKPKALGAPTQLAQDERATIDLFERSSPSVVHIATSKLRRDPFRRNVLDIPQGTGSGFIWDERGYVVTNFHVVAEADAAVVTLNSGEEFRATLVGTAPDQDLAVLKIQAPETSLPEIAVGTSRGLRVGQRVYAIGNPFGLDQTLTTGIIGGLDREITSLTRRAIRGVIQTDAAINPGNSGGPL